MNRQQILDIRTAIRSTDFDLNKLLDELSPSEIMLLQHDWFLRARDKQLLPDGDWRWWLLRSGRGFGKLLALDCPIPTPTGWTMMGDIQIGDTIFDELGNTTKVTYVSPIQLDKTYRITFSDNTEIIAGASHQWVTWTHSERKSFLRSGRSKESRFPYDWARRCPRTTQQIVDTLTFGKRWDRNHCIPNASGLVMPDIDLPIAPYTLGLWLGDGSSHNGGITAHQDDMPQLRNEIEKDGYETTTSNDPQRFGTLGVKFRQNDLYQNKHVPLVYFRSSIKQRLALLQGLMDSDGGVEAGNCVSFTNTNERLADAVYELVVSLGMKATRDSRIPFCNGHPCKRAFRVTICAILPVFRLRRKLDRLTFDGKQALRNHHRMIVKAEEIDAVPMRCIQVDSPNSMYLISKAMIPTHNTEAGAQTTQYMAEHCHEYCDDPTPVILLAGRVIDEVRKQQAQKLIDIAPPHYKPRFGVNGKMLVWPPNPLTGQIPQAWMYSGDVRDASRGPNSYWAWCDELSSWQYPEETFNNINLALRVGKPSRGMITTTPKPIPFIRKLDGQPDVHVTIGSTLENTALDPATIAAYERAYAGSRLGRQELDGEILPDLMGAMFSQAWIDRNRIWLPDQAAFDALVRSMDKITIGVDPHGSDNDPAAEDAPQTGIIVGGKKGNIGYCFRNLSTPEGPLVWATKICSAYKQYKASYVAAEVNYGGKMVAATIHNVNASVPVREITSRKGKDIRAEPISTLMEQNRIKHVEIGSESDFTHDKSQFRSLERQLTEWTIGQKSPDEMDAYVHCFTELLVEDDFSGMINWMASKKETPKPKSDLTDKYKVTVNTK